MKKIKEFPKKIQVTVKNDLGENITLNLIKEVDQKELSGLSQKVTYKNLETGAVYFVKSQKPRKIADIFGANSPVDRAIKQNLEIGEKIGVSFDEYTGRALKKFSSTSQPTEINEKDLAESVAVLVESEQKVFNKNFEIIQGAANHVREVLIERAFLEALSPQIVKAMMGTSVCVPENIFFITEDGEPLNLSQSLFKSPEELKKLKAEDDRIIQFIEPLAKKEVIGGKHKPEDWEGHKSPSIEDFKLSAEDGLILGELYFVALLIGHWDLFNNIDLSNSGYVEFASGKKLPAIVDHGNDFFTGFSGLTKDESFAHNPDRISDFKVFARETNLKKQITGFQYTEIFDDYVALLELPRSLISDLFNLTEKSTDSNRQAFRQAQRKGFQQACEAACNLAGEQFSQIHTVIPQTIEKMFSQYMSVDDAKLVKRIINKEIYHQSEPASASTYNLANIMRGRLQSLVEIQQEMNKFSVAEISNARFRFMLDSQFRPATSKREQLQKLEHDTTHTPQ